MIIVFKLVRHVSWRIIRSVCVSSCHDAPRLLSHGSRGCVSDPIRPFAGSKFDHAACRPALDAHKARLRVPMRAPLRHALLSASRDGAKSVSSAPCARGAAAAAAPPALSAPWRPGACGWCRPTRSWRWQPLALASAAPLSAAARAPWPPRAAAQRQARHPAAARRRKSAPRVSNEASGCRPRATTRLALANPCRRRVRRRRLVGGRVQRALSCSECACASRIVSRVAQRRRRSPQALAPASCRLRSPCAARSASSSSSSSPNSSSSSSYDASSPSSPSPPSASASALLRR